MLIEFSVSNFRSFRERQTLSLVAAPRLHRKDNVFSPMVEGEKVPDLLKACVIYGPNASGKSNLLRALNVISSLALQTPSLEHRELPVSAFRFDPSLADEPSKFEMHFVYAQLRYRFEVWATKHRIIRESLIAFPKGKEQFLYARSVEDGAETYEFGSELEGGADLHQAWRKLTSPTLLFIAQAVANSNEDFTQLRKPMRWLRDATFPVMRGMGSLSTATQNLALDNSQAARVAEFLSEFDIPVSKLTVEKLPSTTQALSLANASIDGQPKPSNQREPVRTWLTHQTKLGEAQILYSDQSEGTKNLIGFWLPWTTREPVDFDDARCVLIVDEMDSSLHPLIVERLVAMHQSSERPSQLIFTTHDTHLMDAKLLRRDQIWIAERDENGATKLRSVHDFVGREGEDVEKRYYEGRYRGLPIVGR